MLVMCVTHVMLANSEPMFRRTTQKRWAVALRELTQRPNKMDSKLKKALNGLFFGYKVYYKT